MNIVRELGENNILNSRLGKFGEFYGALSVAARYCGLERVPAPIKGTWQHGHHGPELNIDPEIVVGLDGTSRFRKSFPQFVAREDQRIFLESKGYSRVEALGLPYIYGTAPRVARKPRSLLVMPSHTLQEEEDLTNYKKYAEMLCEISGRFEHILICLHGIDFDKGTAKKVFENSGFQVIRGSDVNDANSIDRMWYLFSRFEFVTSNMYGSQIPYAAMAGARVSIWGPIRPIDVEGLKNHTFFLNYPEGASFAKRVLKLQTIGIEDIFTPPWASSLHVGWAKEQLGVATKKSPGDLRRILGWTEPAATFARSKSLVASVLLRVIPGWGK
jgi:hypothetical protein